MERVELVSCGEGALEAATRLKLPKFCQHEYFGFAAYSAHLDWIRGGIGGAEVVIVAMIPSCSLARGRP